MPTDEGGAAQHQDAAVLAHQRSPVAAGQREVPVSLAAGRVDLKQPV
ncbi:hypothetical protein ACWELV_39600 [Streptomyces mirabilis]